MDAAIPDDATPLPEGARVVHIGPPKTGTTALQGAFHVARAAAEAQGVHYAGRNRHSISAVQAVLGKTGFYSVDTPPDLRLWRKPIDDVSGSSASRVVLSSEFFADAKPDAIRRVVDDLDASLVQVVVTLRPLARIVPSQWQQYVQSNAAAVVRRLARRDVQQGAGTDLAILLVSPPARPADRPLGGGRRADRITVVALDEGDHDFVLRAFEGLTGLTSGTLLSPPDAANRSLTMAETEAVRAFNIAFRAEGLSRPLHSRVMNFGAARYMKEQVPPADAARVETPQWALDPGRRGRPRDRRRDRRPQGVHVVGDLESLAAVPESALEGDRQPADHRAAVGRRLDGHGRAVLERARP